jgi:hypothetical protein
MEMTYKISWDVDVCEPYDSDNEKYSLSGFSVLDGVVALGVCGEINENYTDITIKFSNGDHIYYTYNFDIMCDTKEMKINEPNCEGYNVPFNHYSYW